MTAACNLCPHGCKIPEGGRGLCHARGNTGGKVESFSYGVLTALALDPIEKKPLSRYEPGKKILSAGSFGCNMRCAFCQNWRIAASDGIGLQTLYCPPERLVKEALKYTDSGNIGLAYTYNEPLVNYEYVYGCSVIARGKGLKNVLVTNGMLNPEPFDRIMELTDAANIDLKSFSHEFYRNAGGDLDVVMRNIKSAAGKIHLEVNTLIIEGLNDSPEEMEAECRWLAGISPEIPLHLSRFFPNHKMTDRAPTAEEKIYRLRDIALRHLKYVYLGNM